MTPEEMADLDIHPRAYQKIEAGENAVSLKSIYVICKRLKIDPGKLFPVNF